jgi:cell division septum initiation protein DivIVA
MSDHSTALVVAEQRGILSIDLDIATAQMAKQMEGLRVSLPVESYLRPWLDSAFAEIQDSILCDMPVRASYIEAAARCEVLIEAGNKEAERVKDKANQEAEKIVREARSEAERILSGSRRAIQEAARALGAL